MFQLTSIPALLAVMADITQWLHTHTVSNFPGIPDFGTFLDHHSCALVAGTTNAEVGHWGEGPVVEHEVDVAHAEAGAVEADEKFVVLCWRGRESVGKSEGEALIGI
jgi:hypothetical protein